MKIVHVAHLYAPCHARGGGLVRVAEELSVKLRERGHDITVLTTDGCYKRLPQKGEVWHRGVRVIYYRNISNGLFNRLNITTPMKMALDIDKKIENADLVHIHEFRTISALFASRAARKRGIPYVVQPHGSSSQEVGRSFLKKIFDIAFGQRILRGASRVIAVAEEEAEFDRQLGASADRIRVVYNGVQPMDRAEPVFKEAWGQGRSVILYLGRINETKGLDVLVRAYADLLTNRQDIVLVIAGRDDGYLGQLTALIDQLGLKDEVVMLGEVREEDMAKVLSSADVFIHAVGYMGGVGLLPLEATMCEVPAIVTMACGEVLKKGAFGHIVEYGDVKALEDKIAYVLDHPREEHELALKGRKYVLDNFLWDRVVEEVEGIYADSLRDH